MRKNQGGFSQIIILLIIVLLLGVGGFFVYGRITDNENKNKEVTTATDSDQSQQTTEEVAQESNPAILLNNEDPGLEFRTEADISKLPEGTPESFKAYFREILKNNKVDSYGCITVFGVSKISKVNINGGASSEMVNGQEDTDLTCGSGAPIIWVLAPNGKWDQETRNGIDCKSTNGGLVYEEFAEECAEPRGGSYIKNPNGSVTKI